MVSLSYVAQCIVLHIEKGARSSMIRWHYLSSFLKECHIEFSSHLSLSVARGGMMSFKQPPQDKFPIFSLDFKL